jgi:hypothetical protein
MEKERTMSARNVVSWTAIGTMAYTVLWVYLRFMAWR